MRNTSLVFIIAIFIISLAFSACGKDETVPDTTAFKGDFISSAHTTKGVASINPAETTLTLTNFRTDSGPDLDIYLASSINNVTGDYIDLGDIKGLNGTYNYDLPEGDYEVYKYVVVWCVDFDVNFGYAELVKQ